jgi:hypothetical protein
MLIQSDGVGVGDNDDLLSFDSSKRNVESFERQRNQKRARLQGRPNPSLEGLK